VITAIDVWQDGHLVGDSTDSYVLGLSRRDPPDPWRVSDWSCLLVWFVVTETRDRDSDMSGACPRGLVAPDCVRGPKWTSNGQPLSSSIHSSIAAESYFCLIDPLFMMHHTVGSSL
jgi:hypothetical protein